MNAQRTVLATAILIAACSGLQPASAQATRTQAVKAPADIITYRVKAGESLYSISEKYFAKKAAYVEVQRINRIANPYAIPPGTPIRIPVRLLRATPLDATLAAFQGSIRIERGGTAVTPSIGMPIQEGLIVQTGAVGFLTLALSNGSRITLPSNSRVRILHMRRFLLTGSTDFDFALDKGRAETTVTPMKEPNGRFRLRTPIAVSAVRGTQFRIGYNSEQGPSFTEVVEGSVAVAGSSAESAPALIPAGLGAMTTADGKVGTEKLLAAPTLIRPGKVQTDPVVNFELASVSTAQGYHVQLAKDAGFIDTIAETRGTGAKAQFADVADGDYFVRAMAIAPSGLEGLSETYGIRRQLTALGGSAGALGPGQYQFKWFGSGNGTRVYRFQLHAAPEGGVALVDETGLDRNEVLLTGLAPGAYYWRVGVRQFAQNGMSENWTPLEKFTVSAPE
jgi:hypothetical protein